MAPISLWVLLCLLPLLLPSAHGQAEPSKEVYITTGQQLADAVADWGASGGSNYTLHITVPYISLRDVTFTNLSTITARSWGGVQPFSSGSLYVKGLPARGNDGYPTVLDTGMRASLITGLRQTAVAYFEDLVLVNLCDFSSSFPYTHGGTPTIVTFSSPFVAAIVMRSISYRSQYVSRVTMYGRQGSMASNLYWGAMERAVFPQLNFLADILNLPKSAAIDLGETFTPYAMSMDLYDSFLGVWRNCSMKSLSDPNDPLLNKLRAEGRLMPPQYCFGGPLPRELAEQEANPYIGPAWPADDTAGFVRGVREAEKLALVVPPGNLRVLPGMVVFVSRIVLDEVAAPRPFKAAAPALMLSGVMQDGLRPDNQPILDLQARSNLFLYPPGVLAFLQYMTLAGLASRVPPRLPSTSRLPPASLQPSVFPLAAFNIASDNPDTWATNSSLLLHNVTLVLPPEDYLALLNLASRAAKDSSLRLCVDDATAARSAQLQAGITTLTADNLDTADSSADQSWMLRHLLGWGMNATQLRLVPTTHVGIPTCAGTPKGHELPLAGTIGLAVGLGVGLILISTVLAMWLAWRRNQRQASSTRQLKSLLVHNPMAYCLSSTNSGSAGESPRAAAKSHGVAMTASASITSSEEESARVTQTTETTASAPGTVTPSIGSQLSSVVFQEALKQQQLYESVRSNHPAFAPEISQADEEETSVSADPAEVQASLHARIQKARGRMLHEGVDKVVLLSLLGNGSGGTVYLGEWRGLPVAVKSIIFNDMVPEEDLAAGAQFRPETLRPCPILEAAIAASMGHRNVVATYHYDIKPVTFKTEATEPGGLEIDMGANSPQAAHVQEAHTEYKMFLVQELCNTNLHNAWTSLDPAVPIRMEVRLSIMLDVAQGLQYLHGKKIIHGDLKPANILLKVDPSAREGSVAKLADFGLSTRMQAGATHVSNYAFGTPFYVAPEVSTSSRASTASDMFCFGVISWELFSHQQPYVVNEFGALVVNPLCPDYPPGLEPPAQVESMINSCLQVDPEQRPSAKRVVKYLKQLLTALYAANAANAGSRG